MNFFLAPSLLNDGDRQPKGCNSQEYIQARGKSKCEANVLRRNRKAADQIPRDAIGQYVSDDDFVAGHEQLELDLQEAKLTLNLALQNIGTNDD
jgi:hypothetical protein